jgi:hypothetical protein
MTAKDFILEFHTSRDFKLFSSKVIQSPYLLEGIIELIINKTEYPFSEYSSWLLTHVVKENKDLLIPFQKEIMDLIIAGNNNQTVLRNCTNVMISIPLITYKESELIECYIGFIKNSNNKVALQVYSMYNLVKFVKKYPELKTELTSIVELYFQERSPAYKGGVKNFLKGIKKF